MIEEKPQKTTRPPQALSSEYHKARKQLMLWAGILFIWELVGIDLEKAKEAGGNAGALITALKSPQAIPWVLLVFSWILCIQVRNRMEAVRGPPKRSVSLSYRCWISLGSRVSGVRFIRLPNRKPDSGG
jgi:hypothetical protein